MSYTLKGSITARTCRDCLDDLSGTTLRIYRSVDDASLGGRSAASTKHTVGARADDDIASYADRLVAETVLGAGGALTVDLGDYSGPIDVELYCDKVGGHKAPRPRQLAITTVQPQWRRLEAGVFAALEIEIPIRSWCDFRRLLGLWVICGQVTVCDTSTPVPNVTVHAFDADWLQDDAIGSAVTDASGHFRIDYTVADFEKTPFSWLHLELVSGPDLYFRIDGLGGTLLAEPRSRGRQADRENVGPCFCADLCVDEVPPSTEPYPVFRYIGGLDYVSDIDSIPAGTGLTTTDSRAFFAGLRLNGPVGRTLGGQPLEYRFEVRELPAGSWNPVLPADIGPTFLGYWQALAPTLEIKQVWVNQSPAPNRIIVTPDVQGWIVMPQDANVLSGLFVPNGNMIVLDSAAITPWPDKNVAAITAGNSTVPAGLVSDRFFGIRLRIRQQGNAATEVISGECQRLAIVNNRYDGVTHGGSWAPQVVNDQLAVVMVDVEELIVNGCSGITNDLHIRLTTAHPNLGPVNVGVTGPGGPYTCTLPAPTPGEIFGIATNDFTVATLPKCAYIVTLSADVLLTTGDNIPSTVFDQVAFCKG